MTASASMDQWRELEQALRTLVGLHGLLLDSLASKREAIRRADVHSIEPLCIQEKKVAEQILHQNKLRQALSAKLVIVPKGTPVTLTALVAAAPPDAGSKLRELGDALKELVERVKRESSIVRLAAEALSQHLSGLMQTIHSAMSSARVYGRRGRIQAPSAGGLSAVDIRS